jgi:hypothetical protein
MIVLGVCDYRRNRGVSRTTLILSQCLEVSRVFCPFVWAERLPALAQAVMAPLICWSLSKTMPCRQRGVAGRRRAERRLTIRERPHDMGAPTGALRDAVEPL